MSRKATRGSRRFQKRTYFIIANLRVRAIFICREMRILVVANQESEEGMIAFDTVENSFRNTTLRAEIITLVILAILAGIIFIIKRR